MEPPRYVVEASWSELDPRTHSFDASLLDPLIAPIVRAAAEASVERGRTSATAIEAERGALALALDQALVARFGVWVNGWTWATSEPGGGGPVRTWCCPCDSLRLKTEGDVETSIANVRASVVDWRDVLELLDARFDRLDDETIELDLPDAAERAAADLVTFVLSRTEANDAWYATFATMLRWYLERRGHREAVIGGAIRAAASGVFESWCAPSDAKVIEAGTRIREALRLLPDPDALRAWMGVREHTFASPLHAAPPAVGDDDGHVAYVEDHDRARDPARADRMRTALDATRASARADEPLTFDRLSRWTSLALGDEARPRTTDAYAKGGRERYGFRPHLVETFTKALSDASRADDHVLVRAARVYLDVCFFHPFEDGNARAARLALDHVLTAAGLTLVTAGPLFAIARSAEDPYGGWRLAHLLGLLVRASPSGSADVP